MTNLLRTFSLDANEIDRIGKLTSYYSVGFVTVSQADNVEEARSAGSGTLVTVGDLHGILTAAHVVSRLNEQNEFGLVVGIEDPSKFQKQVVKTEQTDTVVMRTVEFDKIGPDLAFMRLPQEVVGWLRAQRSFYNLLKRCDDVSSGKVWRRSHCDLVLGIVHELTKDVQSDKPLTRRQQFTAIFCIVNLVAMRYLDEYDLLYYQPEGDETFQMPDSFEGVSGGGVWRFYVEAREGATTVTDQQLVALPFFQAREESGKREIVCHGPRAIHGALIEKIRQKWPDVSNNLQ